MTAALMLYGGTGVALLLIALFVLYRLRHS